MPRMHATLSVQDDTVTSAVYHDKAARLVQLGCRGSAPCVSMRLRPHPLQHNPPTGNATAPGMARCGSSVRSCGGANPRVERAKARTTRSCGATLRCDVQRCCTNRSTDVLAVCLVPWLCGRRVWGCPRCADDSRCATHARCCPSSCTAGEALTCSVRAAAASCEADAHQWRACAPPDEPRAALPGFPPVIPRPACDALEMM